MKIIILTLSFLITAFAGKTQTKLDSLYSEWQDETIADSTRAKAYKAYIWDGFLFSNPDTASVMADELIAFTKKNELLKWQAAGLNMKGVVFRIKGDYPNALDYYTQSLKLYEQLDYQLAMAHLINNIGLIYKYQDDYPQALEYFNQSLEIVERLGNKKGMAMMLNNIGIIYLSQSEYPKALNYYTRSLKISEEIDDQRGMANSLNNIGIIYDEQGDYPEAMDYYLQSLKIKEQLGEQEGIASSLNNIAIIYINQGDFPKALDYFIQSLKIMEGLGDQEGMAMMLNNIGSIYDDLGDYPKALEYCRQGYELALSVGTLTLQKDACHCLYDTYKTIGNSNEALEYHELLMVLNDSIFNEENTRKLTQLEMQYEFDKQEAVKQAEQEKKDALSAQELKRQKLLRNGFIGGFAVVLLFAGVFFFQRNRIGKEKQRSEELLLNILPEETAQELKEKGHSDAQLIDYVTVLFTDFKGFTAISEQVTPKELVADLHSCFSEFDRICEKYGIEKIKTIGDAYMAAGGLPTPNQTHAADVVKAALEMADVVEKGKAVKIAEDLPFFEIRLGVHTGPVVAGIVGVKKFQYDIWGDTVNTASRMESSGEVGHVNISRTTYEILKEDPDFSFESRGKIEAKGKGELDMYFVSKA